MLVAAAGAAVPTYDTARCLELKITTNQQQTSVLSSLEENAPPDTTLCQPAMQACVCTEHDILDLQHLQTCAGGQQAG
jgi:hypothetical protein